MVQSREWRFNRKEVFADIDFAKISRRFGDRIKLELYV